MRARGEGWEERTDGGAKDGGTSDLSEWVGLAGTQGEAGRMGTCDPREVGRGLRGGVGRRRVGARGGAEGLAGEAGEHAVLGRGRGRWKRN